MAERQAISLDEFKARLPLVEIVGRHVRLTRRGREHVGLCPFHGEKTPSFTVSEAKGFYHCFGCGQHGNAIDFVMAIEGLDFAEALTRLAELSGLPAPGLRGAPRPPVDRGLLAANEAARRWFRGRLESAQGEPAQSYLRRRGLDDATSARFGLGYAPDSRGALARALQAEGFGEAALVEVGLLIRADDSGPAFDRFRHRVMFPIEDARGRVVGFGGRALGEAKAKYLNTPETPLFRKGELLYGLSLARPAIRERGTVVVAEGYMDVIALAQGGFAHAVAPLGTAIGESQIALLWRLADEPIICLDGDEAGLRAGHRLIERALPLLGPGKSLRFAVLPPGEDPDSLLRRRGRPMLARVLDEAISMNEFLWARETATRALGVPQQRAAVERRFRELARSIPERSLGRLFLNAFHTRLRAHADRAQGRTVSGRQGAAAIESVGSARLSAALLGPARTVERDLLGPVLAHPELLAEIEEELAALELDDPRLDELRQAILSWYGGDGHLDPEGLQSHLSDHGFAGLVDQLSARGPASAWYGDRGAPRGEVLTAWRARVRSHSWFQARRRAHGAVGDAIARGGGREAEVGAVSVDRLINDPGTNENRRRDRLME